jgi:DNA transformation protein
MAVKDTFLAYVFEQLDALGGLRSRRMFGGVGLYQGEHFFALIDDDSLYFKVDDDNRGQFLERGAQPFRPFKDKPEYSMSYYAVPADILEDAEELARWARKSVIVAAATPRKPVRAAAAKSGRTRTQAGRSRR